jgi:hypothetical protein
MGIDREEARRGVVEIIDGVLQLLEDVFLPLAVARHVGNGPHRQPGFALAVAERADAKPKPAHGRIVQTGDAHLFLQLAAFAGGLQQAIDRLRDVRVADEDALDRPHVIGIDRIGEVDIGGIGIEHVAVRIGHQHAFRRAVHDRLGQGIAGRPAGEAQNIGGKREQRENADAGQDGQQRGDILRGKTPVDEKQPGGGAHQRNGHDKHQPDAAGAGGVGAAVERRAFRSSACLLRGHDRLESRLPAPRSSALPECPSRGRPRKGFAANAAEN